MTGLTFYEFFAGGGLARIGLGPQWTCLFANDIDTKKADVYRRNFSGAPELVVADIHRNDGYASGSRAVGMGVVPLPGSVARGEGGRVARRTQRHILAILESRDHARP